MVWVGKHYLLYLVLVLPYLVDKTISLSTRIPNLVHLSSEKKTRLINEKLGILMGEYVFLR
jgi:hypothetical protein